MNIKSTVTLSRFNQRWLAETLRQKELTQSADDSAAVVFACAQSPEAEERILSRAKFIAAQDDTLEQLLSWRQYARWILTGLCVLMLLGGFSSALAVLGDGVRPVNVVWALGALLGVNLLMLLIWLLNLLPGGIVSSANGSLAGRVWFSITGWFALRFPKDSVSQRQNNALLGKALAELLNRTRATFPGFSSITHLLWFLALVGALIGLLFGLALRSYSFAWETTILPGNAFVDFVALFGWLPAQLGFTLPDAEMVRNSSISLPAFGADAAQQDEIVRRAWASWLLGSLLVYGLLPRLVLSVTCLLSTQLRLRSLRLDHTYPAYAQLAARLCPPSQQGGVQDAAPAALFRNRMSKAATSGQREAVIIGLEFTDATRWTELSRHWQHSPDVLLLPQVDSREQRKSAMQTLAQDIPFRLLIVCDSRLSPDRGILNWIAEASAQAMETRILLLQSAATDPLRIQSWQQSLQAIGLPDDGLFVDESDAVTWTNYGSLHRT